jgi:serine protease Do
MKTRNRRLLQAGAPLLAGALIIGAAAGFSATQIAYSQHRQAAAVRPEPAVPVAPLASPAELSRTFTTVAKMIKPAVVNIDIVEKPKRQAMNEGGGFPMIPGFPQFGQSKPQPKRGSGSGVIINADGYILTNNHVAGEADEIKVKLSDGREFKARRVGTDPETDLALIKIDAGNLPFAKLGDSDKLEQGEWVIALGSPFGLEQTMTAGIVSATQRDLRAGPYDSYIQTDASINPGNSGGPLVNMSGEVIGINTMIFSRSGGSEGIGFAIPSNLAKKVEAQLASKGKVSRGYLGVNLQDLTPVMARNFGYEGGEGAVVGDVASATSPAAKAGLRSGDVITEFNGNPVKSPRQLTQLVGDAAVGKAVPLKYVRDGKVNSTTITLGERPARKGDDDDQAEEPAPNTGKLGISVVTVTPDVASELKLKTATGAAIESVVQGSPAEDAGLQRGDVIHRVNRTAVENAEQLTSAVRAFKADANVVLQVERNGQLVFITVDLGD